jgi:hypothetical protein
MCITSRLLIKIIFASLKAFVVVSFETRVAVFRSMAVRFVGIGIGDGDGSQWHQVDEGKLPNATFGPGLASGNQKYIGRGIILPGLLFQALCFVFCVTRTTPFCVINIIWPPKGTGPVTHVSTIPNSSIDTRGGAFIA